MKVLFVDKQEILLDGIANLLAKSALDLVESANTIEDALNYFSQVQFDIIITDFNLVDDNGLDLIRKAKRIYPKLRIIILSMQEEAQLVKEILREGVNIRTKDSPNDIVEALTVVKREKVKLSDDINKIITQSLSQSKKGKLFTTREKEVLKLISDDSSNQEIAEKLGITEKTVASHRKRLFNKTKTSTVNGLLKYAYANNLI